MKEIFETVWNMPAGSLLLWIFLVLIGLYAGSLIIAGIGFGISRLIMLHKVKHSKL